MTAINSAVELVIDAPADGGYRLDIDYANGSKEIATHALFVDDAAQGTVDYAPTPGWFSTSHQDLSGGMASVPIVLHTGLNRVRLQKATGTADLDAVTLSLPD